MTEKIPSSTPARRRPSVKKKIDSPGPDQAPQMSLELWPDTVRGVPNAALRGALFSISQIRPIAKKRELVAAVDGIEVRVKGERFNQNDLDVWEMLLHLARERPLGNRVEFTANDLLKALDRKLGGTQHDQLKEEITRLRSGTVEVTWTKEGKTFGGGLISEYFYDDSNQSYVVIFSEKMLSLYEGGYTHIDWQQRKLLGGNNLAKWLHGFYASHAAPYPYKVETIRKLCGSKDDQRLGDFRKLLRIALEKLVTLGAIISWNIESKTDLVTVVKTPSASQQRHLQRKRLKGDADAFDLPGA